MSVHGGDIYGRNIDLDFSVNMNPCALNLPPVIEQAGEEALSRVGDYPDISNRGLREALSRLEGVPEGNIVCGNGASELFMAAVRAYGPKRALLAVPCFSGYSYSLGAVGCDIEEYLLDEGRGFALDEGIMTRITADTDMVFLCTPNNPTGRLIEDGLLRDIYRRCRKTGAILVTDACFHPLAGEGRLWGDIIIKAFTKVMSIPGARVGYAVCRDGDTAGRILRQLPEWNLSVFAQLMGRAAAELALDRSFLRESRRVIREEREFLARELGDRGFKVYPGEANFILFRGGIGLSEALLRRGILIRDASNFSGLGEGYYRTAVKGHDDNLKLCSILRELKYDY